MTQPGTPSTPLRVGMVGAGLISAYHLDALDSVADADVTMLVARDVQRAQAVADRYGIPRVVADWRELVGQVDAAIVATPDDTHVEIARGLMSAGIPVMVQKPIATSAAEAEALVADAPAGLLSASFMHRHLDATVVLADILARGDLGEIMSVRMRNATPGPDWGAWFFEASSPTAGVVSQLGVHGIDLVEHLIGPIRTVQALTAIRMPARPLRDGTTVISAVPDHAHAIYRLASGVLVSHEQCWAEAGGTERFQLEVHGTNASAVIDAPSRPVTVHERGGESRLVALEPEPVLGHRHHAAWVRDVRARQDDGTAAAAARGLRVAETIAVAAASGALFTVPDLDLPAPEESAR